MASKRSYARLSYVRTYVRTYVPGGYSKLTHHRLAFTISTQAVPGTGTYEGPIIACSVIDAD
jgi:hypothetical protein